MNEYNATQRLCDTVDRLRNLHIKWTKEDKPEWALIELDEALTNCISDRDTWNWITGETSTAFYYFLTETNKKEID